MILSEGCIPHSVCSARMLDRRISRWKIWFIRVGGFVVDNRQEIYLGLLDNLRCSEAKNICFSKSVVWLKQGIVDGCRGC